MQTVLTTSPNVAAEFVKRGGIVAFPTETVYGLGANVFDEAAIKKIFAAKGRPSDNPLIAHVAEISQIQLLVSEITASAEKFIRAFFPAPLTLVLPKLGRVPLIATANLETIGVRMPRHELAREFIKLCGVPLVAPSANLSGKPSTTTWEAVFEDLNGRVDCILQGEQTIVGLESTVVDCTKETPLVLRVGAVALETLQRVVPETRIYQSNKTETLPSPGLKYRHYSPQARIVLIENADGILSDDAAYIGLTAPERSFRLQKICPNIENYAHEVFAFFRQSDAANIKTIYCQIVPENNLGLALMDRLRRAAA
jgi:L-threonylcarbamoyladenylate synthase